MRGDEKQSDRSAEMRTGKVAAKSRMTTAQVSTAASTDRKIARLTRTMRRSRTRISSNQRSCSVPRLASSIGSTFRARSTILDSRPAHTLRKAPIPANRKTGATASWMICATVVTEVGRGGQHGFPIARKTACAKAWVTMMSHRETAKCLKSLFRAAAPCKERVKSGGSCMDSIRDRAVSFVGYIGCARADGFRRSHRRWRARRGQRRHASEGVSAAVHGPNGGRSRAGRFERDVYSVGWRSRRSSCRCEASGPAGDG